MNTNIEQTESRWGQLESPCDEEVLALEAHAQLGVLALTRSGLFCLGEDEGKWRLLEEGISSVLVSESQEIWAARSSGLARSVDGAKTWTKLGSETALTPDPGQMDAMVTSSALALGPDGSLWTGTRSDWLSFYPTQVDSPAPILEPAGMQSCQIQRLRPGAEQAEQVADFHAADFAFDEAGKTWIAGDAGVFVLDQSGKPSKMLDKPSSCITISSSGWIAAGTATGAWLKCKEQDFIAVPPDFKESNKRGLVEGSVADFTKMRRGPDGQIWAISKGAGSSGVFRLGVPDGKKIKIRWSSHNNGLLLAPPKGVAFGTLQVKDFAITERGAGYVTTTRHGMFCNPHLTESAYSGSN